MTHKSTAHRIIVRHTTQKGSRAVQAMDMMAAWQQNKLNMGKKGEQSLGALFSIITGYNDLFQGGGCLEAKSHVVCEATTVSKTLWCWVLFYLAFA